MSSPAIANGADGPTTRSTSVLIVGAGPSGLMLSLWLSTLRVPHLLIDKRASKIHTGQADGLQIRTMEVLQSFGFGERVFEEAYHMLEVAFWDPDPSTGLLKRTRRVPDNPPGLGSHFCECVLHQGRIESYFLQAIRERGGAGVERAVIPTEMHIPPPSSKADKIRVKVRHLRADESEKANFAPTANSVPSGLFRSNLFAEDELDAHPIGAAEEGSEEWIEADYVVGCDGARSWVRGQLGWKLEGEAANYYWGVLDGIPITDFPDIRKRCAIHSADAGSVMIIPRERQSASPPLLTIVHEAEESAAVVRLYVMLGQTEEGKRIDRTKISPEMILSTARNIFKTYAFDIKEIEWWTCYEISQRLCPNFSANNRVFIAGDACHTHSPKAGQGMNVSMMDTYNLGWKLGHVVKGLAKPHILETYELERRQVAKDLIEFDHKFSRLFSGKPAKDAADEAGISLEEFHRVFEQAGRFTSGVGCNYPQSSVVAKTQGESISSVQSLASNVPIGTVFREFQMVCFSDARPRKSLEMMPSDGRWRVWIFPGDVARFPEQMTKFQSLCAFLEEMIGLYTPKGQDLDSVVEVLACIANETETIEWEDFPQILKPRKGAFGYMDYWKIYVDEQSYHEGHGQAYNYLGVAAEEGAVIILRPDHYVSMIQRLDSHASIGQFFAQVLVPQNKP
ncbi:hypothetical protein BT69DRAFT_1239221 [Atractiella rhizophila]|nr:hypothetical protein BT69DRAFT_1239221 [Atractiella rhizophila]